MNDIQFLRLRGLISPPLTIYLKDFTHGGNSRMRIIIYSESSVAAFASIDLDTAEEAIRLIEAEYESFP